MTTDRVLPRPDADSRPYWAAAAEGQLVLQFCVDCDRPRFYPRHLCPHCHSDEHRWEQASGRGTVYSYSVVHRAPSAAFAGSAPYIVALIDLDEGVRMMSNILADPSGVAIGARVAVSFRHESAEVGIPEFVLEEAGSGR
ncbi:Zn-ribbon domain-containing OB-fold protein [Gordonia sp. LSe1-13]|uniref:Zn-ribbon domain-containing OB-fold protein n=1 Tax=Gordonia sesuvii TaxID=3116777 RepID=A0ABU7MIS0_9ACTN|nr:Zn-ribbon domain-containing OB-fold protein [Gordonia sp. LSe1-13]